MTVIKFFIILLAGYLLGNFSTGIVVSKYLSGTDIRKHGSGNAGATNMLRVLGNQPALLTIVGDVLKGLLAVAIGVLLTGSKEGGMVGGFGAVLGHVWPVFFGFRGGKGAATSFAVVIILFPWQGLTALAALVLVVYITRFVSLGSITGALLYPILLIPTNWGSPIICWLSLALCAIIVFAHRTNIQRLFNGTESKLAPDAFKHKQKQK